MVDIIGLFTLTAIETDAKKERKALEQLTAQAEKNRKKNIQDQKLNQKCNNQRQKAQRLEKQIPEIHQRLKNISDQIQVGLILATALASINFLEKLFEKIIELTTREPVCLLTTTNPFPSFLALLSIIIIHTTYLIKKRF